MRRRVPALLLPVLACSVMLTGCGSDSPSEKAAKEGLPSVSGSYGSKPNFTFPGAPPKTLKKTVLKEGKGPVVAKGDLLVADYIGQIWKGKVFDNTYDRKSAAGFPIGVGKVIPGWDKALVGAKVGSRVLMSVPPASGYGAQGNPQAGIKAKDTLTFVVDIVHAYNKTATGDPKAVAQKVVTPGVSVTGTPGAQPVLAVKKGTAGPKTPKIVVLAKGTGKPVVPGLLVTQYEALDYAGASAGSTWKDGTPAGVSVAPTGLASVFDRIRGLPLGSRMLVEVPAASGRPAVAVVIDLVAQPGTAAKPLSS